MQVGRVAEEQSTDDQLSLQTHLSCSVCTYSCSPAKGGWAIFPQHTKSTNLDSKLLYAECKNTRAFWLPCFVSRTGYICYFSGTASNLTLLSLYLEVWYLWKIQAILQISFTAAAGRKFDDEVYYVWLTRQ